MTGTADTFATLATDSTDESPLSPAYRRLTIGMVMTVVAVAFEALAISTVMPETVRDLDGLSLYGWAFSAFMLAQLIGIATAGAIADVHPPARTFLVGLVLFALGLLVGGLAPTMELLILSRALQGLGAGVIAAIAYVIIGRAYPEHSLPRMLAVMSSAWVVPGLVGPSVASLIASLVSWRGVFLCIIPIPAIALVLAMPSVNHVAGGALTEVSRRRIGDAVVLAAGATAMLAGFTTTPVWLGVSLVVGGLAVLARPLTRLMPEGTFRVQGAQAAATAGIGLLNLAFFGYSSFVPLAIDDVLGHGSFVIGLTVTASTLMWTAGSWTQAHFATRITRRRLVTIGLSVLATALTAMSVAVATEAPVPVLVAIWGMAGIGIGLAYATFTLTILETARTGEEGKATSALHLINALGIAIATGIGGALIALLSDGNEASRSAILIQYVLMTALVVVGIGIAQRLPGARPANAAGH